MRGTLQALAFCHSRNVAHGSMGSGSVLLSTFDDRRANDLIVKLDNFGFGRAHYACSLDLKGGTAMTYIKSRLVKQCTRTCMFGLLIQLDYVSCPAAGSCSMLCVMANCLQCQAP